MPIELTYRRPWLYEDQERAIFDEARISIIEASTKAGKTAGCLAWLAERAFVHGKPGREFWWVAPIYAQAKIAFRRMKRAIPRNVYRPNETELRLTLVNGAAIEFRSAEKPDNLYGEDVWAAVMDESSRMREESWHAIRSTLTHTRGPVRMIGNVHGRKNWFFRLARIAEAGDTEMAFHRLTAADAVRGGVMDPDEVASAERDFKRLGKEGIFRQLYYAEAADDGENPFGLAAIAACVEGVEGFSDGYPAAAGVDLAGRGAQNIEPRQTSPVDRDYTAIALLDRAGHLRHLERFRQPHTQTTERVAKMVGNTPALVDSTGAGDPIVEALQRRGDMQVLGFTYTERSRQELLEHLALFVGDQDVRWPDDGIGHTLRLELEAFEYIYRRSGVTWRVPEGMHDDLAMALALACKRMPWRAKNPISPSGIETPGGSRWMGRASGSDAWTRYQESLKPTRVSSLDEETTVPVPVGVEGTGAGKWK